MASLAKRIRTSALTYSLFRWYLRFFPDRTRGFVFVATTGRSGTDSLSTVLNTLPNCASFHEPAPLMGDNSPPGSDRMSYYKKLFYQRKLPAIQMAARNHDYYVETNHQFIKHFADHAIAAFGDRIRIIHLVREPWKVASSFYMFDSIPGRTSLGRKYMLDPMASDNFIQIGDVLRKNEFSHDYYCCVWYWYETEARVKQLRIKSPQVKWHTMRTEDLNNLAALTEMFANLDLPVTSDLGRAVNTRKNEKTEKKKWSIDPQESERMHLRLLSEMESRYGTNFWK